MNAQAFWPIVGEFCIGIAFTFALFSLIVSVLGIQRKNFVLIKASERSLYFTGLAITFAVVILVSCLLSDNYLVRYVYGYSNASMSTLYKVTALWGGQDGSLLFWLWLNVLFGCLAIFLHRKSDTKLIPYMTGIFASIISFFLILLIFSDNPFERFPVAPPDGRGLNPLLQNPSMAIHPPTLYLGFVGMSVPFAFGMAALISGESGARWIKASRLWTLIAWFFLSIGNLLGAQWAYTELGWGGFWGWDPVENAAILPWFTASAFLHSVMIQEKRGMLKFWNMNLIVISFCLTILGTYLTRSGVVQSVHSFAKSDIGYFFLAFLVITILFCGFWIWKRKDDLRSENIFESFLSKESAFVVNNIVLVGSAFIILWSTLFPSFSELVTGTRIIVGPPFFNKMLAPFGIVLLILTGVGPIIGWRKASKENIRMNFTWPTIIGVLSAGALLPFQIFDWYVLFTAFGVGFVVTTIMIEFYRGGRMRVIQHKETWPTALLKATLKNNRKYGGYIVHIGIVMIFIGIAGSIFKDVYDLDLKPGESASFQEYEVVFNDFQVLDNPNQQETYAVMDLFYRGNFLATVRPARFYYKRQDQPSTEVAIYSRLREDVYFTLGSINPTTRQARIRATLNPLVSWLWMGGLVLVIGGLIAMLPTLSSGRKPQ